MDQTQTSFGFGAPASRAEPSHIWAQDPEAAFSEWRRNRVTSYQWAFSERSIAQHCSMFGQYLAYLEKRRISFLAVSSSVLEDFLESLQGLPQEGLSTVASGITVRRYVQLLAETYDYLAKTGVNPVNPMLPLMPFYALPEADPDISFLTKGQEESLIEFLQNRSTETWKEHRNTAILWALLGAGLTLSEVVALRTFDVLVDDYVASIRVAASKTSVAHTVPISHFAIEPLSTWIERQKKTPAAGNWLFPGTAGGSAFSTSRVYRLVQETLGQVGYYGKHSGPAVLRNTFARGHIHNGASSEQIRSWLGLSSDRTFKKLRQTLPVVQMI